MQDPWTKKRTRSREIQANEYFVAVLAHLLIQDLEEITIPFEDQIKERLIREKSGATKYFFMVHAKKILINQS